MPFKTIVTELLWFLRGDTNIKYLVDNNCHIWDGDAYKNFIKTYESMDGDIILPPDDYINDDGELLSQEEFIDRIKTDDEFGKKFGELGKIYGKQWRSWGGEFSLHIGLERDGSQDKINFKQGIDQISCLINDLKTNPDSRRLMVNAWNVGELNEMILPPCHYSFQVYTRELSESERYQHLRTGKYSGKWDGTGNAMKYYDSIGVPKRAISLMWNQRSVDTFLGLPFNIASYGLLLEIIAKTVNMVPDELIGNLGDTHLYSNHIEQAKEQIGRELTIQERAGLQIDKHDYSSMYTKEELDKNGIPSRTREPYPLPTLKHLRSDDKYTLLNEFPSLWSEFKISDFEIENYQSHQTIKAPLSN
jgi:thymidylate synthase